MESPVVPPPGGGFLVSRSTKKLWTQTELCDVLNIAKQTVNLLASQCHVEPEAVGPCWVYTAEQALAIESAYRRSDPDGRLQVRRTGRRGRPNRKRSASRQTPAA